MADWIIPCNPHYFDVFGAFEKLETIDWRQTTKTIETGDTVYIYVGLPVQSIAFKCRVQQTMIPPEKVDDSDAEFNLNDNGGLEPANMYMRLKLIKKYPPDEITIEKMRKLGLKGNIQGQRRVPNELKELLSGADKDEATEQKSPETVISKEDIEELRQQIREKRTELMDLEEKKLMLRGEIVLLEEILYKITKSKDEYVIIVTEEEHDAHRELLKKLNKVVVSIDDDNFYCRSRPYRFSRKFDLEEDL